jgi:hypothetical protein
MTGKTKLGAGALLRPIVDRTEQGKLRELILDAFAEWEAQVTVAS